MISKCANPQCEAAFHHLRGGRLYRFDMRRPLEPCRDVPNAICENKPTHASVYFWLCGECSRQYALRFSPQAGIAIVPGQIPDGRNPVVARVAAAE